jgi:predicted homoserine dehydrogenase-like protein
VIDRAAAAAARADVRAAVADTERDVARLLDEGRAVIASRPEWVVGAVGVDVVVDATGVPMRARGSRCSRSGGACPS